MHEACSWPVGKRRPLTHRQTNHCSRLVSLGAQGTLRAQRHTLPDLAQGQDQVWGVLSPCHCLIVFPGTPPAIQTSRYRDPGAGARKPRLNASKSGPRPTTIVMSPSARRGTRTWTSRGAHASSTRHNARQHTLLNTSACEPVRGRPDSRQLADGRPRPECPNLQASATNRSQWALPTHTQDPPQRSARLVRNLTLDTPLGGELRHRRSRSRLEIPQPGMTRASDDRHWGGKGSKAAPPRQYRTGRTPETRMTLASQALKQPWHLAPPTTPNQWRPLPLGPETPSIGEAELHTQACARRTPRTILAQIRSCPIMQFLSKHGGLGPFGNPELAGKP